MVKKSLEIHSQNILPIIKKWLYSDKDIFVRELVSNACDAIKKVHLLEGKNSEVASAEDKVEIKIDKERKTLTFSDNGIGMDAEEVQKYIAQIAFSGAEDFLSKMQEHPGQETFIGHFGLGFYSAYMVADKVDINTLSYLEGKEPVFWSCDGSSEYTLEKGTKTTRGTEITLFIGEGNEEYLEPAKIKEILRHYCSFLPCPVYFEGEKINTQEALWMKSPNECTKEEYLSFYRYLYPFEEEPLFWIHMNVDYPFHLKGILYFPKIKRDFDPGKSSIKLYCNRVFVSDSCKEVIPNYLMMLRGIIDSPDIPLNVSRSYLQMDKTVRQLSAHISKKVADHLIKLLKSDRARFLEIWEDVSVIVKLGILEDDKFYERVKEALLWKTIDGEWITKEDYLEQVQDKTNKKIFYTRDPKDAEVFLQIYREKKIPVLISSNTIDPYVMNHLERKGDQSTFQRIDAGVDDLLLDKEREKTVLDPSGKTEAAHLADFVRSNLSIPGVEVEAKSLASNDLPGIVVIGEQERRMRDYMMALDPKAAESALGKQTFIINTNHPLMAQLKKIQAMDAELAKDLVLQTYELSLLSQREMNAEKLSSFVSLCHKVMERIANVALDKKGPQVIV